MRLSFIPLHTFTEAGTSHWYTGKSAGFRYPSRVCFYYIYTCTVRLSLQLGDKLEFLQGVRRVLRIQVFTSLTSLYISVFSVCPTLHPRVVSRLVRCQVIRSVHLQVCSQLDYSAKNFSEVMYSVHCFLYVVHIQKGGDAPQLCLADSHHVDCVLRNLSKTFPATFRASPITWMH